MLVAIHQLHYLPWLRYLDKIHRSDVFIVLDDIQFNKNGWQNRNKLKTASGPVTLTVPVRARAHQNLSEVRIHNEVDWRKKHWRTLEQNYRNAPFFNDYAQFFKETYSRQWGWLNDLNRHMLSFYLDVFGIDTTIAYSSDLRVPGIATERLVNLIKAVGGTAYYSGAYALETYLDQSRLDAADIALELQQWHSTEYRQLHGPFLPDLSIVDLLLNCGPESLEILCGQPI